MGSNPTAITNAFLAQLVERKTFNLVVVGSSPTADIFIIEERAFALNPL